MWTCPKCNEQHQDTLEACWKCGAVNASPVAGFEQSVGEGLPQKPDSNFEKLLLRRAKYGAFLEIPAVVLMAISVVVLPHSLLAFWLLFLPGAGALLYCEMVLPKCRCPVCGHPPFPWPPKSHCQLCGSRNIHFNMFSVTCGACDRTMRRFMDSGTCRRFTPRACDHCGGIINPRELPTWFS